MGDPSRNGFRDAPFQLLELFGGILPVTTACKTLGLAVHTLFSGIDKDCLACNCVAHPGAKSLGDVERVSEEMLRGALLPNLPVLISAAHSGRRGATGARSGLHEHIPRIVSMVRRRVSKVVGIVECTVMSKEDRRVFWRAFKSSGLTVRGPFLLDACHWAPISRPRLWWLLGDIQLPGAATLSPSPLNPDIAVVDPGPVERRGCADDLETGWQPLLVVQHKKAAGDFLFPCFTRHAPSMTPRHGPLSYGCARSTPEVRARWQADQWAQSVYQYEATNLVIGPNGGLRRLIAQEVERLMGYEAACTAPLLALYEQGEGVAEQVARVDIERKRKSTMGNSWSQDVVLFLLHGLLQHFPGEAQAPGGNEQVAPSTLAEMEAHQDRLVPPTRLKISATRCGHDLYICHGNVHNNLARSRWANPFNLRSCSNNRRMCLDQYENTWKTQGFLRAWGT